MNDLRQSYKQWLLRAAQAELNEDYAFAQQCREEAEQCSKEYEGRLKNIHAYLSGGDIYSYNVDHVSSYLYHDNGLELYVKKASQALENYIDNKSILNPSDLKKLIELCRNADNKKAELKEKIIKLENDLNAGKCTDDLRKGMIVETDAFGKTMIDRYKDLLLYDLEPMAQAMCDKDTEQIRGTISIMDNAGVLNAATPYTWRTIQTFTVNTIPIDGTGDAVTAIANGTRKIHKPYGSTEYEHGFKQFNDDVFNATKNKEFYNDTLEPMCKEKGSDQEKKTAKSNVTKIFEKAQNLFKSKMELTPEGAEYLTGGENASTEESGTDFGTEGDWSKEDEGKEKLEDSLDGDFLSKLTNAAGEMGNQAILMVYATEMFSDYSAPRLNNGETPKKTMAGIPMGPRVNYYYHSELEYLYNGNLADAHENLRSVAGMILLVRFIFNYVASFMVKNVRDIVSSIRTALSGTGPFAILVSELARMGLAIGESAMDVERLRQGERVALFKGDNNWKFSISGLKDSFTEDIGEIVLDQSDIGSDEPEGDDNTLTLTYTDYLRLFLLLVDGDTLAVRIANLIELNVTNYDQKINADEEKMASAERFDLKKGITGFSLTTTAEMKMLFLSMPMAQQGVNGVIPPKTLSVSTTDYRGY